jgi:broad specificity phosphatase PhoE
MTRTTVHLLRHGEVYNPEAVLYGRLLGFRLSDDGLQMAHDAAAALRGRDIRAVVASPLQRAQETARPTAEAFGLEIRTDERLIESENVFEGKRVGVGDGALKQPWNWPYLRNPFTPSWGEDYGAIARRMLARRRAPATWCSATRRSASATSCRSGPSGATSRAASSGTARTAGSAAWRRSPASPGRTTGS